jgi:hypothetical protein
MASKRSNAVDEAIRRSWAKLAKAAFEKAVSKVGFDHPNEAESYMTRVERWLDKAGANATRWYF